MFSRIVDVYFKPKPFGIKNNIDLEATSVEMKIYIHKPRRPCLKIFFLSELQAKGLY